MMIMVYEFLFSSDDDFYVSIILLSESLWLSSQFSVVPCLRSLRVVNILLVLRVEEQQVSTRDLLPFYH